MDVTLVNEQADILENACVGPELHLMTLSSPLIASTVEPGQFVHMRIPGREAHILRRPFSVYARQEDMGTLEILYRTVGSGSVHMSTLEPGDEGVELIGPVGRPWQPPDNARRALLVGGGVGAAPLFMLAEKLVEAGIHTDVVLGAQTETELVCRQRYETLLSAEPFCATDDGSFGRAGFCVSLVEESLSEARETDMPYDYLAACGPEPLMRIVTGMAREHGVRCEVSLERRMACGVGACLSCVVDTVDGKRRACVDGPVFDATKVVWR